MTFVGLLVVIGLISLVTGCWLTYRNTSEHPEFAIRPTQNGVSALSRRETEYEWRN